MKREKQKNLFEILRITTMVRRKIQKNRNLYFESGSTLFHAE